MRPRSSPPCRTAVTYRPGWNPGAASVPAADRGRGAAPSACWPPRRPWSLRGALGVLAASLTVATAGALAQGSAIAAPKRAVPVKAIQRALGIRADGIAGPQTRRAIKRFQRAHGLKADGIAGP